MSSSRYRQDLARACAHSAASLPYALDHLRATARQSIVIVVPPLIALMKDQVAIYSAKGLKVGCITGESTPELSEESSGEGN